MRMPGWMSDNSLRIGEKRKEKEKEKEKRKGSSMLDVHHLQLWRGSDGCNLVPTSREVVFAT